MAADIHTGSCFTAPMGLLEHLGGSWTGTNALRVMPTDEPITSAATMRIAEAAGGHGNVVDYTWADQDAPQHGTLLIGSGGDDSGVRAVWLDSWHQQPVWMELSGTVDGDGVVHLEGAYDDARWRIHLGGNGTDVRMVMENLYRDRDPYPVMESTLRRPHDSAKQVTGIGGLFFRARDPEALTRWYETHLGVPAPPATYDEEEWWQEAGPTVFSAFPADSEHFRRDDQQWSVNFRVRDLDAIVAQLRGAGVAVDVHEEDYPNGRFAELADPEGNPVQLRQPAGLPRV